MLEFIFISLLLGVFAIVFTDVLMLGGMIMGWYAILLERFPEWLSKPLGECVFCFAGQLGFWTYLIYFFDTYNLFYHILFITLTIFWTLIYINIWKQNG